MLIVGAGTSGLALAHELVDRGIRPRIVDAADRVGARWRGRHPQLRLNTHRLWSHLPGRRMPRRMGAYPSRDDLVAYLEDYARALPVEVELGVRVERIERGDGGWVIGSSAGPIDASEVVVATGQDHEPVIPDWPGRASFTGRLEHAGRFGPVEGYRGLEILIVGAGNSGVDLANHLARTETGPMWMSVRRGSVVVPLWIGPVPTASIAPLMDPLPTRAVDAMTRAMGRLVHGDVERFGMPRPPAGALTRLLADGTAPALDNGFVAALRAGRISIVPEIERFDGAEVRLVDGKVLTPDVVVCATGYRPGIDAMVGHLGVLDSRGVPRWSGTPASDDHPGLWFLGYVNHRLSGSLRERRGEARGIAERIARRRR